MSQSGHFWDPDGQISEWPEDQMVRCLDVQMARGLDGQKFG